MFAAGRENIVYQWFSVIFGSPYFLTRCLCQMPSGHRAAPPPPMRSYRSCGVFNCPTREPCVESRILIGGGIRSSTISLAAQRGVLVYQWFCMISVHRTLGGPRSLGADGFGRSDTRKNLRKFFEVDKEHIVAYGLSILAKEQLIASKHAKEAMKKYNIDGNKPMPTKL